MLNKEKLTDFVENFNSLLAEDSAATLKTLKELTALARETSQKNYANAVAARKTEREEKRALRSKAQEDLIKAKEDLKTKRAAAKALVSKKKAKAPSPAAAFKPKSELLKKAKKADPKELPDL
jgi:outer membrane protein TolC